MCFCFRVGLPRTQRSGGLGTVSTMSLIEIQKALRFLAQQSIAAMSKTSVGMSDYGQSTAYHNMQRDELITTADSFGPAVDVLNGSKQIQKQFGASEGSRLAIQFVYNTCRLIGTGQTIEQASDLIWKAFVEEMNKPTWSYKAVTNLQNIICNSYPVTLSDGLAVRARSFDELSLLLDWGHHELESLSDDWHVGGGSSFVLVAESEVEKTSLNFIQGNDPDLLTLLSRALLAMRLVAPGDVNIGKIFFAKPTIFKVGGSGLFSAGFGMWHPGSAYELTSGRVPLVQEAMLNLAALENRVGKSTSTLKLALRSFSSIYDRPHHQPEDRIVDAITALEALWQIDQELSFKLAFRTASFLASSDEERVAIFDTLKAYYSVRSKSVHGGAIKSEHMQLIQNDEPLRSIVRRMLKAFLHLAIHPSNWTLERLVEEADRSLIHSSHRLEIQSSAGISI